MIKKVSDRIGQGCLSTISFSWIIEWIGEIFKDYASFSTEPFPA
jgi:hypothetical protein